MVDVDVPKEGGDNPNLPFPTARVVRLLKENCKDHLISAKVKDAVNIWLGKVCVDVAKEMSKSRYPTLDLDDFRNAVKKYEVASHLDDEKARLLKGLEKLKLDVEALERDISTRINKE